MLGDGMMPSLGLVPGWDDGAKKGFAPSSGEGPETKFGVRSGGTAPGLNLVPDSGDEMRLGNVDQEHLTALLAATKGTASSGTRAGSAPAVHGSHEVEPRPAASDDPAGLTLSRRDPRSSIRAAITETLMAIGEPADHNTVDLAKWILESWARLNADAQSGAAQPQAGLSSESGSGVGSSSVGEAHLGSTSADQARPESATAGEATLGSSSASETHNRSSSAGEANPGLSPADNAGAGFSSADKVPLSSSLGREGQPPSLSTGETQPVSSSTAEAHLGSSPAGGARSDAQSDAAQLNAAQTSTLQVSATQVDVSHASGSQANAAQAAVTPGRPTQADVAQAVSTQANAASSTATQQGSRAETPTYSPSTAHMVSAAPSTSGAVAPQKVLEAALLARIVLSSPDGKPTGDALRLLRQAILSLPGQDPMLSESVSVSTQSRQLHATAAPVQTAPETASPGSPGSPMESQSASQVSDPLFRLACLLADARVAFGLKRPIQLTGTSEGQDANLIRYVRQFSMSAERPFASAPLPAASSSTTSSPAASLEAAPGVRQLVQQEIPSPLTDQALQPDNQTVTSETAASAGAARAEVSALERPIQADAWPRPAESDAVDAPGRAQASVDARPSPVQTGVQTGGLTQPVESQADTTAPPSQEQAGGQAMPIQAQPGTTAQPGLTQAGRPAQPVQAQPQPTARLDQASAMPSVPPSQGRTGSPSLSSPQYDSAGRALADSAVMQADQINTTSAGLGAGVPDGTQTVASSSMATANPEDAAWTPTQTASPTQALMPAGLSAPAPAPVPTPMPAPTGMSTLTPPLSPSRTPAPSPTSPAAPASPTSSPVLAPTPTATQTQSQTQARTATPAQVSAPTSTPSPPTAPSPDMSPIQQLLNLGADSAIPLYTEIVLETLSGKRNIAVVVGRGEDGESEAMVRPISVHLSLQTDNLGPVTADLTYGQGLSCTVSVGEDAADLVRGSLPLLRQLLVDAGLRVLSVACHRAVPADHRLGRVSAEEGPGVRRGADGKTQTGVPHQVDIRA